VRSYHLGLDSTDSAELGMCTTYLGARLLELIDNTGCRIVRPPDLVRLNPNVPWKTRGNGAVCIRFPADEEVISDLWQRVLALVEELSVLEDPQTNPGVALLEGEVPSSLATLYRDALHRIVTVEEALEAGRGADMRLFKNGRGIIGALSAIGAEGMPLCTYEAIAYRGPTIHDRERTVDRASIGRASNRHPGCFYNVDGSGEPVCVPRSPCPVLFGMRAVYPMDAYLALTEVECTGMERWVLWRTNQHTDAHIEKVSSLSAAVPYGNISFEGTVRKAPSYRRGGHLSFVVADEQGMTIPCWAYEPTKGFRKALSGLSIGDTIRIWGSVRQPGPDDPMSINLEKVRVLSLARRIVLRNPRCPVCGGSMGSMGKDQGLRCKACGARPSGITKERSEVPRTIDVGMIEPPECAWRHLFKPSTLELGHGEMKLPGRFWGYGPKVSWTRERGVIESKGLRRED